MREEIIKHNWYSTKEKNKTRQISKSNWRRLMKSWCEDCGIWADNLEIHHKDYANPNDVVTLCPECHTQRHRDAKNTTVVSVESLDGLLE